MGASQTRRSAVDRVKDSIDKIVDAKFPYALEMVSVGSLVIDAVDGPEGRVLGVESRKAYQRIQDGVVKKILANGFKPLLLLPLIVNKRSVSIYSILDGGGRFRAIKALISEGKLPKDFRVPCLVCKVDAGEEPKLFIDLNREKLGLSQVDIFLGLVAAEEPDYVRMNEIVEAVGLKIGRGKGQIASVDAIKTIYNRDTDGAHDLRRVLRLLEASDWLVQTKGTSGAIIGGLGMVVNLHNPAHTDEFFMQALQARTPEALHSAAFPYAPGGGGSRSLALGVAYSLAEVLNVKNRARRGSKKFIEPDQFLSSKSRAAAEAA